MFHHTIKHYEVDQVIECGNWGRVVMGLGAFHRFWFREDVWERVRASEFAARPSRFSCSYAYADLQTALKGRQDGNPDFLPHIYEVEPVEPDALRHEADLFFMNYGWRNAQAVVPGGALNLPAHLSLARRYLNGERVSSDIEILVQSDLRVLGVAQAGKPVVELGPDEWSEGINYISDGSDSSDADTGD